MIDFGFDKIALIAAVALIVIGPEKLPKVARTVGHLFGKAQRYVSDVKAEVNRSIELDELKKMRSEFENAARDVEQSVRKEVNDASAAFDKEWKGATAGLDGSTIGGEPALGHDAGGASDTGSDSFDYHSYKPAPIYQRKKKNWRLKRGTTPQWYKQRQGVRTKALSGAARVARYRPPGARSQ
jgi:sec-independent protein translocase protein TatB